jgi:thioredoxin 1
MNTVGRIITIAALVVAVGIVVALKQKESPSTVAKNNADSAVDTIQAEMTETQLSVTEQSQTLPRLVDLGAGKCIPCKMMAPVLEELKNEYAGSLRVDVFDVEQDPNTVEEYKIWVIPTQIFLDGSGKELFRHEGFMSKEDILAKWAELGVELTKAR